VHLVYYKTGITEFPPWSFKRLQHEADHSPPYSVKIKKAWSHASTSPHAFTACRGQLYLHLSLLKPSKQLKQKNMIPMFIPEQ